MQVFFARHEEKYLLSAEQAHGLIRDLALVRENPGEYLVQSIYFDTDNWDVIRSSIEKPLYKEKLRLRCYDVPGSDPQIYLELKKKFNGVVYKQRELIPFLNPDHFILGTFLEQEDSHTSRELAYYLHKTGVQKKIFLSYTRAAFTFPGQGSVRITFDRDVYFRLHNLAFNGSAYGSAYGCPILSDDMRVMELKTAGGIPLGLARYLSEKQIFPVSFSKYGRCYSNYIFNGEINNPQEQISA